jgi:nanoRNase/pAp phosphatase (c-di-AMP/oligoRNAs hydrolase)
MAYIDEFTVPIINHTDANTASEFIGALSEGWDFAVGYFDTDKKRAFNLRTRKKDIDCGAIAKRFGGGGHPGAAGFSCDLDKVYGHMNKLFFIGLEKECQKKS